MLFPFYEKFTNHSQPIKIEGGSCIFNFPYKVENILSEAVLPTFQIHFLSPESVRGDKVHANFVFNSEGLVSSPSHINNPKELNFIEDGDSSPNLKVRV